MRLGERMGMRGREKMGRRGGGRGGVELLMKGLRNGGGLLRGGEG